MLLKVYDYIRHQHVVSTQQLARVFRIDELALQPMLDLWVKKGAITSQQDTIACKRSCFSCKMNQTYYQFVKS